MAGLVKFVSRLENIDRSRQGSGVVEGREIELNSPKSPDDRGRQMLCKETQPVSSSWKVRG